MQPRLFYVKYGILCINHKLTEGSIYILFVFELSQAQRNM